MRKTGQFGIVLLISVILIIITIFILREGKYYGPVVVLMSLIPAAAAMIAGLNFSRLIPDIVFGAIDTGC